MIELSQEPVSPKTRDLFNKGFAALERGNLEYAMDMLTAALELEPGSLQTRKFLRAAQLKKVKAASGFTHFLAFLDGLPQYVQARFLLQAGKAEDALRLAEKLMRKDPMNGSFIRLLAQAAEAAGCPDIAIQTLAMIREHLPNDLFLISWLGDLYIKNGQPRLAREIFEFLVERRPTDAKILKSLKDSMALDSMSKDGWSQTGSQKDAFRKMLRDEDKSKILEQGDKSVKTTEDTASLIADTLRKVEAEPGNINYRRTLANLYAASKDFDKAVAALEEAQQIAGGRDPQVDAAIAQIRLARFEYEAGEAEAAGQPEQAAEIRRQQVTFRYENIRDRVSRYPNDLPLRYEYGLALFQRGEINDAIQQFQTAQRSPADRIRALFHIGLCFKLKKQYDMAADQIARAVAETPGMTDVRKEMMYELGQVYEMLGDKIKAIEQFKAIYQVDIGYKDVAQKIEKGYAS